jgi:hypothetical protein
MSTATLEPPFAASPARPGPGVPPAANEPGDLWPRTGRLLPWLVASFIVMLWLVPFDSVTIGSGLGIDLKLDRLMLVGIATVWIATVFAGGPAGPRWKRTPLDATVLLYTGIAVASVLLNVWALSHVGEIGLAMKKLALLFSYATFFFVVTTSLRRDEAARFMKLFLGLGVITAAGVLYQYWSHSNPFFDVAQKLFAAGFFHFRPLEGPHAFVRTPVTGPAIHSLAPAAMFAMALGIALVGVIQSRVPKTRVLYAVAGLILLAGVFATSRKTGTFASAAAVSALVVCRPRRMLALVPVAVLLALAAFAVRPTAVEQQINQVNPGTVTAGFSAEGRKADYSAVAPDVRRHVATGRGYGTYDAQKYRILDNNYLLILIETGLIGLGSFGAMMLAVPLMSRGLLRSRDERGASAGLIAISATAAFAVANALFDAMAFPQVPYMFFFLAGMVVVASPVRGRLPGVVGLPPLVETLADPEREALPALTERLEQETVPLPPLLADLERELGAIGNVGGEAAGGEALSGESAAGDTRGSADPARRLPLERLPAGSLPPLSDGPASDLGSGAPLRRLPASSQKPPEPGRVETASAPAPPAGAPAGRRKHRQIAAGAAVLALAVALFGRGGGVHDGSPPALSTLSGPESNSDPLGLGAFAPAAGDGSPRAGTPNGARRPAPVAQQVALAAQRRAAAPAPRSAPAGQAPSAPAPRAPTGRKPAAKRPAAPPRPRHPGGGTQQPSPQPAAAPQPAPAPAQPAPMCATVPTDVMKTLEQLRLDPCGTGVVKSDLQRAFIESRITATELHDALEALKL